MRQHLWNIVLAAGSGRRLAHLTGGAPKQFWSADAGPTLLENTLERTAPLAPRDRTVIVVDRTHAPYMRALPGVDLFDRVLYQPRDRGTAMGVLLGLTEVIRVEPDAIVMLSPSDHGVAKPHIFTEGIVAACREVRSRRAEIVIFGVVATRPDPDYGWITPVTEPGPSGLGRVAAFVEKPTREDAARLFASGAIWNTMVLVARASSLLELYNRLMPDVVDAFSKAFRCDPRDRQALLDARYEMLPCMDFSRDLLGRARHLMLYTWPEDMGWSDLGTPERLRGWHDRQDMRRHARRPARGIPAPQPVC
jgi:mannose-1-phosphate guanylyltransferase